MFRTIFLALLVILFAVSAASCAPNVPDDNPKYQGGVQGLPGDPSLKTPEVPADDTSGTPAEPPSGSGGPSTPPTPPPPPDDDSGE